MQKSSLKTLRFQLTPQDVSDMRPQIVTASNKRNVRFRSYAFTEHGAIMAATVLDSPQAVQMREFVDIITPSELPELAKKPIGFGVRERHMTYRVANRK